MQTLALMLTDVVGSTRLWSVEHDDMSAAMVRHHEIVHATVAAHGGWHPPDQGEGDAVFAAFSAPSAAVACAVEMQRALAAEPWPTSLPVAVRIGLHVGEVEERDGNLFGEAVNRCARLRGLGGGGQTLLSAALQELVRNRLPAGVGVVDLGEHRMKDLAGAERVWQLSGEGLDGPFPPLASLDRVRHNLPVQPSTFVGREAELRELVDLVRQHRLVTVTGFGGMGKTRLALQAAAQLADGSLGDVWLVDLASVEDPGLVPARVAEVLGIRWGTREPAEALADELRETDAVLVLDNLEHLLQCTDFLADLLARASGLRVLATSREAMRLRGERQLPLQPLAFPAAEAPADALSSYDAVRLFVDRALAVKPGFVLDETTGPQVVAVCARLDGHPLALELAAARLRVLSLEQLLNRLDDALAVLTGGARDMPARHQTLRATIAWSFDALSAEEQQLLSQLAVLEGAASYAMVEAVCGAGSDVLDLLEGLVDKSLVRADEVAGEARFGLLASIREYALEQLSSREVRDLQEIYAEHVRDELGNAGRTPDDERYAQRHSWVDRELDHVRAALRLRQAHGPLAAFVDLLVALDDTFVHRGLAAEYIQLGEGALATASDTGTVLQPEPLALLQAGLFMARWLFALPSHDLAKRAIAAARSCADPAVRAEVYSLCLVKAAASEVEARDLLGELDEAVEQLAGPFAGRGIAAAEALRFVDPAASEAAARELIKTSMQIGIVYVCQVRLDRGDWQEALSLLAGVSGRDLTGVQSPNWVAVTEGWRAQALLLAGRLEEARSVAYAARAVEFQTGAAGLHAGRALIELERQAGEFAAGVRAADEALTRLPKAGLTQLPAMEIRWRRAVCRRALGHGAEADAELAAAREAFAASELYGQRELLGVLVARATAVADEDPAKAAAIVASVQAHRRDWLLPFGMDRDLATLSHLPPDLGPPAHPTEIW